MHRSRLTEGIHDLHLFKCLVVIGGTGSGKSTIIKQFAGKQGSLGKRRDGTPRFFDTTTSAFGLKLLISDIDFERIALTSKSFSFNSFQDPEIQDPAVFASTRRYAKNTNLKRRNIAIESRQGIIWEMTTTAQELKERLEMLTDLGYECALVVLETNEETQKAGNTNRERIIPDLALKTVNTQVQTVIDAIKNREQWIQDLTEYVFLFKNDPLPNSKNRPATEGNNILGCTKQFLVSKKTRLYTSITITNL